jgi:DNA primase
VEELIEAGLLVQKEADGGTYDRFRDRLMIPIRDAQERVIGFGARTLDPEGVPKYINSPQTTLFDKGGTLFGLDLARKTIRREDRAIIVEGYMDVMQAHQAGFANVVAQMGTALTESQLRQLQRYTKRLVLALDPDAAGVQATLRGIEVARDTLAQEWEPVFDPRGLVGYEARLGAEIRILQLPRGKDPDDLIREDPHRWATLIEEAVPVVDFYLQLLLEELDPDDTKAKAHVVDTLSPVLQAVANPVERDDYVQKIARALRVNVRAIQSRLHGTKHRAPRHRRRTTHIQNQASEKADLEGHCLSALLHWPSILSQIDKALTESQLQPMTEQDFQDVGYRAIFGTWKALLVADHPAPIEKLREQLPADLEDKLEELLTTDDAHLGDEHLVRDVTLTLLRLRERNLKRLGQELSMLTTEAQQAGDLRAEQYTTAWLSHTTTLRRTQQALAQRWEWMRQR